MKEEYENLLERQCVVEEKIDELEQQLELAREGLEAILMHLGHMNEVLIDLLKARDSPQPFPSMSVTQPFPGWTPTKREKPATSTKDSKPQNRRQNGKEKTTNV